MSCAQRTLRQRRTAGSCFLVRSLQTALPARGNLLAGNPPVIRGNLVDDDHGRRRVLAEHLLEQAGDALDEPGLLLGGDFLFGDLDVDVWHGDYSNKYLS